MLPSLKDCSLTKLITKLTMNSYSSFFFIFFFVAFTTNIQVCFSDCDNIQDTCPAAVPPEKQAIYINGLSCKNPTGTTTAQDFKTEDLSKASTRDEYGSSMKIVTASNFPGLNTLGLSIGRIDMEKDGMVNLHNHPRATEMIFVYQGVLEAAFLDTQNQIFQKSLKAGDVFVIPKGLFHYFLNSGSQFATVFSVFNSQNPELGSLRATPSSDTTLESVEKLKGKLISLSDSELDGVTHLNLPPLDIIYS